MRQEKILFEKALQRVALFWKCTGIQINYDVKPTKRTLLYHFRKRLFYIANFVSLISGTISVFGLMRNLSIQIIFYMIPCMTFSFLSSVKTFYFLYHEDVVYDIINTLRKLQSTDHSEGKDGLDNEFVRTRFSIMNLANKLLLYICYFGVALFFFVPLVIIAWQYWSTGEIKFFLPYTLWYPFDEYSYIGWPWAFFHQFWAAWTSVFYIYGTDCFFYIACTFVHNQFCSLQFDMQKIGPKIIKNGTSFRRRLGNLVHRHQELIRCVDMLNVVFGKSILFNVLSSSFMICLSGINIMIIDNLMVMAPCAPLLFFGFIQIFILCYYGDMIMRISLEVNDAIFNSEWYQLDKSSMKLCLFILMRAQKTCKITAFGYTDINLATFSRIISSSWSYFTILNTMYSKHNA